MAHPEEPTLPEDTGQRKNKNMEEIMKTIVKRTVLAVCTLVLALILPTTASAACTGFACSYDLSFFLPSKSKTAS